MDITKELHTLAMFSAADLFVVSVYLDRQWHDQHQHERTATFLRSHLRQADTLTFDSAVVSQSLEDDLARIAHWGTTLLRGTEEVHTPGVALFTCSQGDLWVECPSPRPFENEFTIADRPSLRQLARLDDDCATALVVLVDSRAARICEVVFGGLMSETDIANDVPGRHQQGGWAQMHYQRHVKDHMDRHHKEVADFLGAYIPAHPQTMIILCGQDEILANVRHFLSPQVEQQIINDVRLDIHTPQAEIVQVAQEVIERHEREEEQELVQRLLNRTGHGGLAVVGMQETLAAVNTGRAHMLILHRDLTCLGWRCLVCGHLGEGTPPACTVCGGRVAIVELGAALVSRALQTDAFVEQIEPDTRLAAYAHTYPQISL